MSKANLRLDFIDHRAARYAVERWHYSKRMPSGKLIKVGVWEVGEFIGVVIFGRGANQNLGTKLGVEKYEICELVRVALTEHHAPVSQIVAVALRLLKRGNPGLRVVVSFADPAEGHHGGIYQAMGWTYTGQSPPSLQYFFQGRWQHIRQVTGVQFGRQGSHRPVSMLQKAGKLPRRRRQGKHRYVLAIDAVIRRRIAELARPYPKREDDDAAKGSGGGTTASAGRFDSDHAAPSWGAGG